MDHNVRYFLLRRLHSLVGVFPLGIFLFAHLTTNSMGFFGAEAFEEKVALIHSLGPLLPWVEAITIFIPLTLHIVLGIAIALTGKSNVSNLPYARNRAYTLQRASGWAALAFILYHVIDLRFLHDSDAQSFSWALAEMFKSPVIAAVYFVGATSVIYHFANGLCTFCMSWGITVGPKSQALMAKAAIGVGATLMGMMLASMIGFARMDVDKAKRLHFEMKARHEHANAVAKTQAAISEAVASGKD
jgi:succinate dehydrogenase / fumarate reductase cytochrome b subunit